MTGSTPEHGSPGHRAVFLDRDGVLVPDGEIRKGEPPALYGGAGKAIARLNSAGWLVVVVTNQPAVARGWLTESDVTAHHEELGRQVRDAGGHIQGFFFCPHHPHADLPEYRTVCDCRKPRPGLLHRAASVHSIDVTASVMVGDRMTDIEAGYQAGCALTILVETGMHTTPRITTDAEPLDIEPGARAKDLVAASQMIVGQGNGSRRTGPRGTTASS